MTSDEIRDRLHQLRGIPLESVLVASAAQRDHQDKAKWHTAQGAISVTGMKFMNWNQGHGGGGAIDLAMHLNGLDFKAAVGWLRRCFALPDYFELPPPPPRPLTLPPPDYGQFHTVKQYLVRQRGIPSSLIVFLAESRRLYADHRGNAVFLLLGTENQPVGAELRATGFSTWRGMATGSHKDLGYFSVPAPGRTSIILCESAIDAMSCFLLHPSALCLSTSGARPNPRWLPSLLSPGHSVYCGFDADSTGDKMAQHMIDLHPTVQRLRPNQHDWNDVLKSLHTIPLP
jgi:hypothetical protein